MIITVTPNPSLDRTLEVEHLVRGAVHRAGPVRLDAGGKGVNIARALTANGHAARAVLPCGGSDGAALTALLDREGIDHVAVPIEDAVRTNITVAEADGTVTKLNTPGPVLAAREVDALLAEALDAAAETGATWIACSGSLPPGVVDDLYGRAVTALRQVVAAVAVDSSGAPLVEALAAGPDLIKPNHEELAEVAGRPVRTLGEAVDAAQELRERGVGAVLVSLGPDGALLVDATGAVHGEAPVSAVRSTVGAGDATLAGFLAAGGHGPVALAEALAWGAAAVGLPGSRMPAPSDLRRDRVVLHPEVDRARPLHQTATTEQGASR
jgi:1-phosphofructokinase